MEPQNVQTIWIILVHFNDQIQQKLNDGQVGRPESPRDDALGKVCNYFFKGTKELLLQMF